MNETFYIGTHLSVAKGFARMGLDALSIGANTFQFFTRNPRGAKAKELDKEDVGALRELMDKNGFGPVLAHAPYTLNPCSPDARVRELAGEMLQDDLRRMELLPGNFYNLHPGSAVGGDRDAAIAQIAEALNEAMFPQMQTTVLLETMAGKGSEVGRDFSELRQLLDRTEYPERIGVCMDSCHMWDSGYDLIGNLDGVLEAFDRIIGLSRLKAFHLNDSLNLLGSRKDRHALIGKGHIGLEGIVRLITHPLLHGLPFVLETPTELAGHREEIALLKAARAEYLPE